MSDEPPAAGGASGRIKIATLLTIVGLMVTLAFNTLGVWRSAQQEKEGRETQQISLLTTLNASATDSEQAINQTGIERCGHTPEKELAAGADELLAALDYYEYLAWLFNHGRLTVGDSREFFANRLTTGWRIGLKLEGSNLGRLYPELKRFVGVLRPDPECS